MSMSSNNAPHSGDGTLGVGEIISSAFALTTRNIFSLFILILPIYLIYVAMFGGMYMGISALLTSRVPPNPASLAAVNPAGTFGALFFVLEALYMIAWLICCCAMIRMIHARFNGIPEPLLSSLWQGARRSVPVLGLSLLILVGFVVATLVVDLVISLLAHIFGAVVVILAFAAFVAVFYIFFPYILSGIVCVIERSGPLDSLARSRNLTEHYRWPMLGLLFLAMLILAILEFVLAFIFRSILQNSTFGFYFLLVIGAILLPYVTGWMMAVYTIAYNRLNLLKGGTPAGPRIANVFE